MEEHYGQFFFLVPKILFAILVCFSCRKLKIFIHTIKPTHALMLKLYFYTQFVITPTCFSLSLSSSGSYLTLIPKRKLDILQIWTNITTCKTTTSPSYELVLHCCKWILYVHTFYGQILMYLTVQPCFYMCFIDVKYLPEDDQGRSKHAWVMTFVCKNIILTLVYVLVLLCELFMNALTWKQWDWKILV